jgi:hypothetical protein
MSEENRSSDGRVPDASGQGSSGQGGTADRHEAERSTSGQGEQASAGGETGQSGAGEQAGSGEQHAGEREASATSSGSGEQSAAADAESETHAAAGQEGISGQESGAEQGRIRYQDPESTTPREPTLAERRARERAEQRQREAEQAEREAAERQSAKRRKLLIGGGVTVGVVALVAAFYSASTYSEQANSSTRYCSTEQGGATVAEQEQFCDENYVNTHGGYVDHGSGMFFMPLFLPGGQRVMQPYRYGYTSGGAPAPTVGSTVRNPSFTKPSGTTIKSPSGSTVSRGGFGFGGKSGGS